MNEAQTDAVQQASTELQQRIDNLNSQRDAAQQAIGNAEALLPELEAQLAALKEGLPEEVTPDE